MLTEAVIVCKEAKQTTLVLQPSGLPRLHDRGPACTVLKADSRARALHRKEGTMELSKKELPADVTASHVGQEVWSIRDAFPNLDVMF